MSPRHGDKLQIKVSEFFMQRIVCQCFPRFSPFAVDTARFVYRHYFMYGTDFILFLFRKYLTIYFHSKRMVQRLKCKLCSEFGDLFRVKNESRASKAIYV